MNKYFSAWISATFMVLIVALWFFYAKMADISHPFPIKETGGSFKGSLNSNEKPIYYFGVISRFPPTLIYQGYQPIMDYLNDFTPYHFELKLSHTYKQTVRQLSEGEVVAAFLGSFLFAKDQNKYGLHCILKPLNAQNKPFLRAAVVTRTVSGIHSIEDLRGRKVALPSALSFSANWFLFKALPHNKLRISQLDSLHFFAHHHTVIYEILKGNFDAGVVKERVAREFINRGIRIVAYSLPVPSSPIVVSEKSPRKVVTAIKNALLAINVNKDYYKRMVSGWDFEFAHGFIPAKDRDYYILLPLVRASGREAP